MADAEPSTNDPSGFLGELIGSRVKVKLNSGVEYKGKMIAIDGFMHLAMEDAEEYVVGSGGKVRRKYGEVFLRGNTVMYIAME